MKPSPAIVANEFDPFLSDDDWPFAAETMAKRPVDDSPCHPSFNQHPFGPRLDWN
jgi:hypothetical protein